MPHSKCLKTTEMCLFSILSASELQQSTSSCLPHARMYTVPCIHQCLVYCKLRSICCYTFEPLPLLTRPARGKILDTMTEYHISGQGKKISIYYVLNLLMQEANSYSRRFLITSHTLEWFLHPHPVLSLREWAIELDTQPEGSFNWQFDTTYKKASMRESLYWIRP